MLQIMTKLSSVFWCSSSSSSSQLWWFAGSMFWSAESPESKNHFASLLLLQLDRHIVFRIIKQELVLIHRISSSLCITNRCSFTTIYVMATIFFLLYWTIFKDIINTLYIQTDSQREQCCIITKRYVYDLNLIIKYNISFQVQALLNIVHLIFTIFSTAMLMRIWCLNQQQVSKLYLFFIFMVWFLLLFSIIVLTVRFGVLAVRLLDNTLSLSNTGLQHSLNYYNLQY